MLDWRNLPPRLAATLAAGLPEESRSMLKWSGQSVPFRVTLQAAAVDALNRIEWRIIGQPGGRPPASILEHLNGGAGRTGDVAAFDSPEEFEAALAAVEGG